MTATVVQNYTPEQTEQVVAAYVLEGKTVEDIAVTMGKSVRSIIAKLSREKVYTAKAKTSASDRVTKGMLVAQIAAATGATEEVLDSLEKATKEALMVVAAALTK